MSWLVLAILVVAALAALVRFGGLPRSALEISGAALLIGAVGYALQGSPAQPGTPVQARAVDRPVDPGYTQVRQQMLGRFGGTANYLDLSERLVGWRKTREAVILMRTAIARNPRDPDLWVGLGNALVAHADGLITPPATFAYQRAAQLAPDRPGPYFFQGLALAQSGRMEEAAQQWRSLLARTPKDAPWRPAVEARLTELAMLATTEPAKP